MRRKLLAIIAAMVFVLPVFCLTGCGGIAEYFFGHSHKAGDDWKNDETGHWHGCSGCDKQLEFADHDYTDSDFCIVCGYPKPEESPTGSGEAPDEGESEDISDSYIITNASSRYGYNWLGTRTDGEKLKSFYGKIDVLANKVWNGTAELNRVSASGQQYWSAGKIETTELDIEEIRNVYNIYLYDHPYCFWQDQTNVFGHVGSTYFVHLLVIDDYKEYAALSAARAEINANIKKLYKAADHAATDYEITAAYYREIAMYGDYTFDAPDTPAQADWAHSIVGLLDDDDATGPVCEGYARTFQLMLNLKGVENIYCVGNATSDGVGGGGGHAWNMAKLDDGKWYYYDLTWDDGEALKDGKGGNLTYEYFAVCSTQKPRNKKLFTQSHDSGSPASLNGHFLYGLPATADIASEPYGGADYAINEEYSDGSFVYIRNGLKTVGIRRIKTNDSTVTIPATVKIGDVTYLVTEIGPYIEENGVNSTVLQKYTIRTVKVPVSVTSIQAAAFLLSGDKFKIHYAGTEEQWGGVTVSQSAFPDDYPPIISYNS